MPGLHPQEMPFDASGFDGIRIRVRGDGNRYKFRLKPNSAYDNTPERQYQVPFDTVAGEWIEVCFVVESAFIIPSAEVQMCPLDVLRLSNHVSHQTSIHMGTVFVHSNGPDLARTIASYCSWAVLFRKFSLGTTGSQRGQLYLTSMMTANKMYRWTSLSKASWLLSATTSTSTLRVSTRDLLGARC